jgi:alpha-1,6-mannosyltransferase
MLQTIRKQQNLVLLALLAATFLCALLTIGGLISYFQGIMGEEYRFNNVAYGGLHLVRAIASAAYLTLCLIYLVWLVEQHPVPNTFREIVQHCLPFLLLAGIAYPLSNDIYLYLQYGLMALNGLNPYITPAIDASTILSPLVDWPQTSTYGPISMAFFIASASVVPLSPVLGVYLFKVFCVLVYCLNGYLIWRLLPETVARNRLTMAYLLNPFLLIAQIADAHVDILLTTSVIVLVGCLYHRWYIAAVLALVVGFFTKTLPILWLPIVINFLIRRGRWQELAVAATASVMIAIGLIHTALPNLTAWQSLLNPGVSGLTARSLHHLVSLFLTVFAGLSVEATRSIVSQLALVTYFGFLVFYLWTLLKPYLRRQYSESNLVIDLGWVALVLFLYATPWLMSWYGSSLLAIAVLSVNAPLFCLTTLVFCLSNGVIFGAGSGLTALSIFACLFAIIPATLVIVFRQRVLQICAPILAQLQLIKARSIDPVPLPTPTSPLR